MKILSLGQFRDLPAGSLFCNGSRWVFGELSVKGRSEGDQSISMALIDIDSSGSSDRWDRLEEMATKGARYPMVEDCFGRDCFNENDLFLVLEKADLMALRARIDKAIEVAI